MVYNISYDLHSPEQKYNKFKDLIIELSNGQYCHALNSTYVISSDKTAKEIHDFLSKTLDDNDHILIMQVTQNYYGYLNSNAAESIHEFINTF